MSSPLPQAGPHEDEDAPASGPIPPEDRILEDRHGDGSHTLRSRSPCSIHPSPERTKRGREFVILNGAEQAGMALVLRPEHANLMLVHQEASTQVHTVSRLDRVFDVE